MGIVDSFASRLNECMVIDSAACSKVRHKLSSCSKCVDVCKSNAVRITSAGGKVLVDWDRCTGCGLCAAVCPNRVFSMKLADMKKLMNKIQNMSVEGRECRISCRDIDESANVRSLAFADRRLLVKSAALGASRIVLEQGECGRCNKHCMITVENEVKAANRIFELGELSVRVSIEPYTEKKKRPSAADRLKNRGEELSRREFFGFMRTKAKQTIGETLYSLAENEKERQRTVLSANGSWRENYISDLKYLGSDKLINRTRGEGLLMSVRIDIEKCTRCGICARVCPMSVFGLTKETVKGREITTAVTVDENLCTGCGLCVTACMSDAVKVF